MRQRLAPCVHGPRASGTAAAGKRRVGTEAGPGAEYTSPADNLFPEAGDTTNSTRPEIYAMGFRNPFRFSVDKATGDVLLGTTARTPARRARSRPAARSSSTPIRQAGNYGWPYCTSDNSAANTYTNRTFTGAGMNDPAGERFNCQAPVNDSPRNTGHTDLPPAQAAWIFYDNCSVPELGCGSESPMGGPTYDYDPNLQSDTKFPGYHDGKKLLYEWGRGWIKTVTENADGSRGAIEPSFNSMSLTRPMALEFGPEGSLYVLDYGSGFFFGDENSGLYRIDYVQGKRAPIAAAKGTPDSGTAPLTVQFSSEGSRELDTGDSITRCGVDHMPGGSVGAGCTIKSVGGLGLYRYDQEVAAPDSLRLEWMVPGDDNSGIFVGFPNPGTDPWVAVNQGEEIQIDATDDPDSTTGAIYNERAADAVARDATLKPPGEWNEYEVRVEADRIIVLLNGQKIDEWIDDDPNVDLTTGYIGIRNHGSSGPGNLTTWCSATSGLPAPRSRRTLSRRTPGSTPARGAR